MARNPTQSQVETQFPRVETQLPRVAAPEPRVELVTQTPDNCRVRGNIVASNHPSEPAYISQDDDEDPPTQRYPTRSTTRSIMQEAILHRFGQPKIHSHTTTNVLQKATHGLVL